MILEKLDDDSVMIIVDENLPHGNIVDVKCREIEYTLDSKIRSILFKHVSRGVDFESIGSEEKVRPIKDFVESNGIEIRKDDCIEALKVSVKYRYYRDDDIMWIHVRDEATVDVKIIGNTILEFAKDNKLKDVQFLDVMKDVDISMLSYDEQELIKFVFYENLLDNMVNFKYE